MGLRHSSDGPSSQTPQGPYPVSLLLSGREIPRFPRWPGRQHPRHLGCKLLIHQHLPPLERKLPSAKNLILFKFGRSLITNHYRFNPARLSAATPSAPTLPTRSNSSTSQTPDLSPSTTTASASGPLISLTRRFSSRM